MGDLESKATARKKRTEEIVRKNDTVDFFTRDHGEGTKAKIISSRVNEETYEKFKRICKLRGTTANAQINIMMSDFVLEYDKLLRK